MMNCAAGGIFQADGKAESSPFKGKGLAAAGEEGKIGSPNERKKYQNVPTTTRSPLIENAASEMSDASETISTLSMNSVVGRTTRGKGVESKDNSTYNYKHDDEQFMETAKEILRILKDHENDPGSEAILLQKFSAEKRIAFAKAVRFRVKLRKMLSDISPAIGPVDKVVQECEDLGLGRGDHSNVLIKSDLKRGGGKENNRGYNKLNIVTEESNEFRDSVQSSPMRIRPKSAQNATVVVDNSVRQTQSTRNAAGGQAIGIQSPVYYQGGSGPMFPSPNNQQRQNRLQEQPLWYSENTRKGGNYAPPIGQSSLPNNDVPAIPVPTDSQSTYVMSPSAKKITGKTSQGKYPDTYRDINGKRRPEDPSQYFSRLTNELKEAQQFLETSYSPQDENYWHEQIADLKSKLQQIGAEVEESDKDDDSVSTSDSKTTAHRRQKVFVDTSGKANSSDAEDGDNEVFYPVQAASERMTVVYMKKNNPLGEPDSAVRIKRKEGTKSSSHMVNGTDSDASKVQSEVGGASNGETVNDKNIPLLDAFDMPKARVVAPANLPEGYTFEARVGNKRFMATVPKGGVKRGKVFYTYMKELDKVEVIVPVGEWRDDLCDVCAFGPCHPVLLNSFFFPHISLGQVMSRATLDYKGHEGFGFLARQSCITMAIITYSVWAINILLIGWGIWEYFEYNDYVPRQVIWIPFASINVLYIIFFWYATCATRHTLRSRYMIPERRCYKCEDICCATFCAPCSIAQMNRHTGDFNTFRALCCSETGMPKHVAVPVNPDAKQIYDYEGPTVV